jgi:hypothetical protein
VPQNREGGAAKWRGACSAGFQIIPNALIRAQKHMGIDATDLVILLNLTMHWWGPHDLPYPRPAVIANRMGVGKRTIERRLRKLEGKRLIERLPPLITPEGAIQRRFRLEGLVNQLLVAAATGLDMRTKGAAKKNNVPAPLLRPRRRILIEETEP